MMVRGRLKWPKMKLGEKGMERGGRKRENKVLTGPERLRE
jgi:hypothetical protein